MGRLVGMQMCKLWGKSLASPWRCWLKEPWHEILSRANLRTWSKQGLKQYVPSWPVLFTLGLARCGNGPSFQRMHCACLRYKAGICLGKAPTENINSAAVNADCCNSFAQIFTTCIYGGEDCLDKFVEQVLWQRKKQQNQYQRKNEYMRWTKGILHKIYTIFDLSIKQLETTGHITRKDRGAARVKCNLDFSFKQVKNPFSLSQSQDLWWASNHQKGKWYLHRIL